MSALLEFNVVPGLRSPRPAVLFVADQVPLAEAVFCDNCEMITRRGPSARCRHCQSDAIIHLVNVLGRTGVVSGPQEVA